MRSDSSPVVHLCDGLIQAGVLVALLAVPLYFNVFTYRIFEPDKAALLRSVVLIATAAWCAKRLLLRRPSLSLPSMRRLPPLFPAVLVLLAITAFSTAISILPRISLWGSYERGQGLYTLLAYFLLFFLAFESAQQAATRERILDVILLASVPVASYAILQHFGLDILKWQTGGTATTVRAISTLGNPIFLGAYLIMVIPITLARIAPPLERVVRARHIDVAPIVVYGTLLVLQMLALFFAQSRGPVIGLLAGLAFGGLALATHLRRRYALLIGIGMLVLAVGLPVLARISGLTRLTDLFNPTARTARQRVLAWKGVTDLLRADPTRALTGYGPGTLREALQPFLPAELARLVPDQDFDRAHNLMLDTWAEVGILGVIAWLAVIVILLFQGLRLAGAADSRHRFLFGGVTAAGIGLGFALPLATRREAWVGVGIVLGLFGALALYLAMMLIRGTRRPAPPSQPSVHAEDRTSFWIPLALTVAVVAHLGETLVGLPTISTRLLFWVYAAMIAAMAFSPHREREREAPSERPASRPRSARRSRAERGKRAHDAPVLSRERDARSLWTGIALALLAFPFVTAGTAIEAGPQRGFIMWMVLVFATLLFDILFDWHAASTLQEGALIRHFALVAGAVFFYFLLTWAPLPPLDLTRTTVAVFLYVITAVFALGVLYSGVTPRQVLKTWKPSALQSTGLIGLAVLTLGLLWFLNVNPIRADVFYKDGLTRARAGDWNTVATSLLRSVALMPGEDRYHSALGAAYVQRAEQTNDPGQRIRWLQLAEASLLEAHRQDPYRADHLRNLGVLQRRWADLGPPAERTRHLRQASEYYRQAVTHSPISVRGWREWGEIYAALGEWGAAIQRYEKSLQLNDGFVETWLRLGEARLRSGDFAGAQAAYAHALDLDQERVLQELRAATNRTPDAPWPHQALALAYTIMGQSQSAKEEAQTASRLLGDAQTEWMQFLKSLP